MENTFDISDFVDVLTISRTTKTIVDREIALRKQLKITQKSLAKKSGVSYASIRRFESMGEISLSSLLKIALTLNSLQDFLPLFKPQPIFNLKDFDLPDET
jgi:transcriptional regulator with XRE-family HTH domain